MGRIHRQRLEEALIHARGGGRRRFRLAALGIRADGVQVRARNSAAVGFTPKVHAEHRLALKLTPHSTVYVARSARVDGTPALARPCRSCLTVLKAAGVAVIYYTIGPDEYGVIVL